MHTAMIPSMDEILQVMRKAGFSALTPLQEKIIPFLLKGKDVAVEAADGSGKTVGFMLPLVLGLRGQGPEPHALILASSAEEVAKATRAVARFARVVRDIPAFVPLGEIEDARREQRRLEKGATIVAGTADRVIDHLRRGSLRFDRLQMLVVEEPQGDGRADFVRDVQFIVAKMPEKPQTVLFSQSPLAEENELAQLLRRPVQLDSRGEPGAVAEAAAGPSLGTGPTVAGSRVAGSRVAGSSVASGAKEFLETGGASKADLLARLILGRGLQQVLVLHAPRSDAPGIARALAACRLSVGHLLPSGSASARAVADRRLAASAFSRKQLDVLLAPFSQAGLLPSEVRDLAPAHIVYYDLPSSGSRQASGPGMRADIVALTDKGQEKELSRLQEAIGVKMVQGRIPDDDQVLAGAIDRAFAKMKQEEPGSLTLLLSRIRKHVPLLQRPLFMASLMKSLLPAGMQLGGIKEAEPMRATAPARAAPTRAAAGPRAAAVEPAPARGGRAPAAPAAAGRPQGQPRGRFGRNTELPQPAGKPPRPEAKREGEFTQLFVSIGRNRRVFARDLTDLFTEKLGLSEGDIGGVRVFEKYSFVDIVPGKAGEAISLISGSEVKGRTVSVNYAKKKEEKGER
jgi:hypothetical protein